MGVNGGPHCFTWKHKKGLSNCLKSPIEVSKPFDPAKISQSNPEPPKKPYIGIWDTGASATCITKRVATDLGLSPITFTKVNTASGSHVTPVYAVALFLGKVMFDSVQVTEAILTPGNDLLIGMDIIGTGDLAISNFQGKTTFSFRVPSMACTDFCEDARKHNAVPTVGRNSPCPCGSNKKFKRCCGA